MHACTNVFTSTPVGRSTTQRTPFGKSACRKAYIAFSQCELYVQNLTFKPYVGIDFGQNSRHCSNAKKTHGANHFFLIIPSFSSALYYMQSLFQTFFISRITNMEGMNVNKTKYREMLKAEQDRLYRRCKTCK